MKIHEYQAKEILREYGVKVPRGRVTDNAAEAYEIAREFGGTVAVKAQIHAGGRGKGGGVKIARSPSQAEEAARQILGMNLVTHQTGPEGSLVRKVLIEEGLEIQKEFYLGITLDRSRRCPALMGSSEGGVEIEKVAAESPDKILKEFIDPGLGLRPFQSNHIAFGLGLQGKTVRRASQFMDSLFKAYMETDASLAEINPLVVTGDGEVYALDAKMNFDDNALFRHPPIRAYRDFSEEEPLEIQASRFGLSYIKLDGNVACMVNGAGLAMATMDIIKLHGGNPANFLDVGGGASEEAITNAFRILVSDEAVQAVLINIFGGIMRCDVVAKGVVNAAREIGVELPIVVRLEGTNVKQGRQILEDSDLSFAVADGMGDAAEKVVRLAGQAA
ncbi:MAG TPA: ADP-forming succinate--CoA ligase subunit beta [Acidobacteriota bacterium]|nr:ADP-forming succinate--CoA ligase subunit beta [Acidobacteriota bacterium]